MRSDLLGLSTHPFSSFCSLKDSFFLLFSEVHKLWPFILFQVDIGRNSGNLLTNRHIFCLIIKNMNNIGVVICIYRPQKSLSDFAYWISGKYPWNTIISLKFFCGKKHPFLVWSCPFLLKKVLFSSSQVGCSHPWSSRNFQQM